MIDCVLQCCRRAGVLAVVVAVWLAGPGGAHAADLRLSWDVCGNTTPNKTFACNTNSGTETIVASFTPTFGLPKVAVAQVFMTVCFESYGLPDWWCVVGSGCCRAGALSAAVTAPGGNCAPIWDPAAGTTAQIFVPSGFTNLNGMRFVLIASIADSTRALDMVPGQHYELGHVLVDHRLTVGTGACSGCSTGARIGSNFIWLFATDGGGMGTSVSSGITWQVPTTNCTLVSPVRRQTWGALKALYR